VILNEINAEVKTLLIDSADLIIDANFSLTVIKNTVYEGYIKLLRKSKLLNMGNIIIESGSDAIYIDNDAYLENENKIQVLESSSHGFLNKGILDNRSEGVIELFNGNDYGFESPGSISNAGIIQLTHCGSSWCGGILNNTSTGEILIRMSIDYLSLEVSGPNAELINSNLIEITYCFEDCLNLAKGINYGKIRIDSTDYSGIKMSKDTFENFGIIHISRAHRGLDFRSSLDTSQFINHDTIIIENTVGSSGLAINMGASHQATCINTSDGKIFVNKVPAAIRVSKSSDLFINQGEINISNTSQYGGIRVYGNAVFDHQAGHIRMFELNSTGIVVDGGRLNIQAGARLNLENSMVDLLDIKYSASASTLFECWGVMDLIP
jgi:hypothetical protein